MYKTLSYVCFIVGIFYFGIITFPIGIVLANQGAKEGENTGLAKALNIVGLFIMILIFLFLFMLL